MKSGRNNIEIWINNFQANEPFTKNYRRVKPETWRIYVRILARWLVTPVPEMAKMTTFWEDSWIFHEKNVALKTNNSVTISFE